MVQEKKRFVIFCRCTGTNPIGVYQYEKATQAQCPYCGEYRRIPRGIVQVSEEMEKARLGSLTLLR